jgi:organic radical activating enzyme
MYLQITTKCNMTCAHCCYSCGKNGKHMDYEMALRAMDFICRYDDETLTIGGGEPTLHPRFFDILRVALRDFNYVWMATNGSQTKVMERLANIIDGVDYESFAKEDYCTCDDPDDDDCYCEPRGLIDQEDKLSVALSQDPWHDSINERIVRLWQGRAERRMGDYRVNNEHFEIRDVSRSADGASAVGRAKRTGAGWSDHCVCSVHKINPDGKIVMCGCKGAPVIGDVCRGIDDEWEDLLASEKFRHSECYRPMKGWIRKILRPMKRAA